jgi:hypothetical protein
MRFVDIWSLAPSEAHEFRGATCSVDANARWLGQLATVAGHPVAGYVTQLQHAHALWEHGRSVLKLAGIGRPQKPLPARRVLFQPGAVVPADSYCVWQPGS